MKKIVAILLLVAVVFTLSSCGLAIDLVTTAGLSVVNAIAPDYEEPECEFRFAELSITLTEAFADYSTELAGQFISYAMTQVLITRFENSLMSGAGLEELAEEYQSLLSMNFIEVEFSDTVVDGDKTHSMGWKTSFEVVTHIDVVSPEAGKVLDDHAIYLSRLNVVQQTAKRRTLKIRASVTVI